MKLNLIETSITANNISETIQFSFMDRLYTEIGYVIDSLSHNLKQAQQFTGVDNSELIIAVQADPNLNFHSGKTRQYTHTQYGGKVVFKEFTRAEDITDATICMIICQVHNDEVEKMKEKARAFLGRSAVIRYSRDIELNTGENKKKN